LERSLAARRRLDELERALWATTESTLDALGNGDFYFIAGIVHLRDALTMPLARLPR